MSMFLRWFAPSQTPHQSFSVASTASNTSLRSKTQLFPICVADGPTRYVERQASLFAQRSDNVFPEFRGLPVQEPATTNHRTLTMGAAGGELVSLCIG